MFMILLFSAIALITNILLFSLMIKISVLKLKLSSIKAKSSLPLSVIKLKINMKMLLLSVFELIMMINIKILILIFIVLIMTSCENLFILKTPNRMGSLNDLIRRFSALLTLLLKTLILIKSIDQNLY